MKWLKQLNIIPLHFAIKTLEFRLNYTFNLYNFEIVFLF